MRSHYGGTFIPDDEASDRVAEAVRAITTLMVNQQLVGVDLIDLRQVLEMEAYGGGGRRGFVGTGDRRAARAHHAPLTAPARGRVVYSTRCAGNDVDYDRGMFMVLEMVTETHLARLILEQSKPLMCRHH